MTTNGAKAWFLASRPKTLTGAAAPVIVAMAWAWKDLDGTLSVIPALLCLFFAFFMQIDANFINDYFDYKKGVDKEDRLGPERACAQGWITPKAMKLGIGMCTVASVLTGLPLMWYGGWQMILVGLACVIFCFLYTTTFSSLGLGDLLVLVFFGLVPVCATYYIQAKALTTNVILSSVAMGLVTDLLLIVNNYRDREQDKACGKRTIVVAIGSTCTEWLYLSLGVTGFCIVQYMCYAEGGYRKLWVMLPFLILHWVNYSRMKSIHQGRELNKVLGTTAVGIFLFAVSLSIAIII